MKTIKTIFVFCILFPTKSKYNTQIDQDDYTVTDNNFIQKVSNPDSIMNASSPEFQHLLQNYPASLETTQSQRRRSKRNLLRL